MIHVSIVDAEVRAHVVLNESSHVASGQEPVLSKDLPK